MAHPQGRPRVSVVVCTHNGGATLRECLAGLAKLDYPDYEVIVVDDGSTDDTAAIAREYSVLLVSTANHGLARARNKGLALAGGEIVAYIDDDAFPDPDWLTYLVEAFERGGFCAVGGPNVPPADDGTVAECVAAAPGGPVHVLLADTVAEHIPGCNMAFRRDALEAIGGFDPRFVAAGDDVDVCWAFRNAGGRSASRPRRWSGIAGGDRCSATGASSAATGEQRRCWSASGRRSTTARAT